MGSLPRSGRCRLDALGQEARPVAVHPGVAEPATAFGVVDVGQLGIRAVEVVVDEDVVELSAVLDLALGVPDPPLDHLVGVLGPGHEAAAQLGQAGRQDEHAHGVFGAFGGDLAGALPVDVEQDVATFRQRALDGLPGAAVAVAVDVGPFQEGIRVDALLELSIVDEVIVAA